MMRTLTRATVTTGALAATLALPGTRSPATRT